MARLFHVKHNLDPLLRALDWIGETYHQDAVERCRHFADLLVTEGIPAGAIGPNEASRVWDRHIVDSVCFAAGAEGIDWLDVGSGGGLPGIPLALCYPQAQLTLLDRSGRRTDLLSRWLAVLRLDNAVVMTGDIDAYEDSHDTLLFRGSLRLDRAIATVTRLEARSGVFGFSHGVGSSPLPSTQNVTTIPVPDTVLDTGVTLLRITP